MSAKTRKSPIIEPPEQSANRCSGMMTRTRMLCARAGAAAIAAALALSPTYAAAPKPIIDLSKSPALSGKAAAAQEAIVLLALHAGTEPGELIHRAALV